MAAQRNCVAACRFVASFYGDEFINASATPNAVLDASVSLLPYVRLLSYASFKVGTVKICKIP